PTTSFVRSLSSSPAATWLRMTSPRPRKRPDCRRFRDFQSPSFRGPETHAEESNKSLLHRHLPIHCGRSRRETPSRITRDLKRLSRCPSSHIELWEPSVSLSPPARPVRSR